MSVKSSSNLSELVPEKSFTPHGCLRILMEQGYVFDLEVYTLKDETHREFKQRRWRAEIWESRWGKIKGIAEAPRKSLSVNAAILDLVERLRSMHVGTYMPRCVIPTGVKISPIILTILDSICTSKDLGAPQFLQTLTRRKGGDLIQETCSVGDISCKSTSFDPKYAKLKVALKVFSKLSQREFKLDEPFVGPDCLTNDQFYLIETEQTHIVNGDRGLGQRSTKRARISSRINLSASPIFLKLRGSIESRRKGPSRSVETPNTPSSQFSTSASPSDFDSLNNFGQLGAVKEEEPQNYGGRDGMHSYVDLIPTASGGFVFPVDKEEKKPWPFPVVENPEVISTEPFYFPYNQHQSSDPDILLPSPNFVPPPLTMKPLDDNPRPSTSKALFQERQKEARAEKSRKLLRDPRGWNEFKKEILGMKMDRFQLLDEVRTEAEMAEKNVVGLHMAAMGFGKTIKNVGRACCRNFDAALDSVTEIEEQRRANDVDDFVAHE